MIIQTEYGDIDEDDITDYTRARSHIIPKLINREADPALLQLAAHKTFLDLAVIFLYLIRAEGDEFISFTVKWEQLTKWGIDIDTLYSDSIETGERLLPLDIESIENVLGVSDSSDYRTFYVLTNSKRHFGAAAMLYDRALSGFADSLGQNFHVVPSSIHEVLLVPDGLNIPSDELRDMLYDVNNSIVRDDEVLSDRIYYYDRTTDSLT